MPATEEDFKLFYKEYMEDDDLGVGELLEMAEKRFPNPNDVDRLFGWHDKKILQPMLDHDWQTVDLKTLIKNIENTNYHVDLERARLTELMMRNLQPWIPVGKDGQNRKYRLIPNPFALIANPKEDDSKEPHPLVSESILEVNLNVEPIKPQSRCKASTLGESTKSGESDDSDVTGWTFYQLGHLEYIVNNSEDPWVLGGENMEWLSTGYNVVLRLSRTGRANGVYIIFDWYPKNEEGDRVLVDKESRWGYLPCYDKRVSCAKLTAKLSDFKLSKL